MNTIKQIQENPNYINRHILTYDEMASAKPGNSQEPLVNVRKYDSSIIAEHEQSDMQVYTGESILVRDTLARKLATVNKQLKAGDNLRLRVVYGFRHPKVQEKYFRERKAALQRDNPEMPEYKLIRLVHDFIAVPDVAGHPMGAAVDLTIVDRGNHPVDMGNKISDYSNPDIIKTFAKVTPEQASYRKVLHDAMIAQCFAPFYGEWWHFSYGDREWAAFYGKKAAIYGTINVFQCIE